MTGYLSALTSRFWQKASESPAPPIAAAYDNTSDKAQAIAKKSILSIGYWIPSWDSTALNQFANEQEACAAKILLSPFPQKFTSLNSLYTLLTQILQNSSRIDPEILEEVKTLLQEFEPEVLENTFAEMFKDLDPAKKQEIIEAFKNLAPTMDKLASGTIPSGDKLGEDQKFISALNAISRNIDIHRSFYHEALDYLKSVLQPYTDKNGEVLGAYTLISNKLEQGQYSFTFKETSVLASAVKYLYAKERPKDPFFKALHSFLCLAPTTVRKEASRTLSELNEELKLLPNDKKIIEKLEGSSQGSYLPKQAEAYFYFLQSEGFFERLQNKEAQIQELEKVNNILFDFVESNTDRPNRHLLSSVLDHAQNFLLNPETVSNPPSQDSQEQPSAWNRMKSAVNTVFGGNQNPSAPKELSTIDKVGAITDKLLTLTTTFKEFIQTEIAAADQVLGKTAEKLANLRYHPTEDNIQEAIKLLDRLLSNPKEIIKKDQWEAKSLATLTDLKAALSTAKNSLEPGIIKQLRDAEEILLEEMQDLNGDIPNLLHMLQTFFLNRDEGFLAQSFNQLNAEFSNFLKTQTAEGERSLNLFKSFLLDPEHGLTSAFFNQVESRAEQLSGKLSNNAYPDLEDASHALYRLKRALEISSKRDLPKLIRSVIENINILKHQKDTLFSKEARDNNEISILDALIVVLSQPVLPKKDQLLPIVKQAKTLIDKEIGLQLGYGPKLTRSAGEEVNRAWINGLDEVELRVNKYLNRFGLNLDDDEENAPFSYVQVLEAAGALQRLLAKDPSAEDAKKAIEQLSNLISSPLIAIKREWTEEERTNLVGLHAALQDAIAKPSLTVPEPLQNQLKTVLGKTLEPFTTTPLNKIMGSLSDTISQLVTLSTTKAGAALSKTIGSQVALGARALLEASKGQLESNEKYKPIVKAIEDMIPFIENAEKSGEFNELLNMVKGCYHRIKSLPPIYINGIPLFFNASDKPASSLFSPYADGISKDKKALHEDIRPELKDVNYASYIDLHKKEFVQNTSNLIILKSIYETVCGVTPDEDFYTRLMDAAREESTSSSPSSKILRTKFFEEINKLYKDNRISILHKFFAEISYLIMTPFVKVMIGQFASYFIDYVYKIIIKRDEKGFAQIQDLTIDNLNSYLGVLGDAYEHALKNPAVRGSLPQKVEAELQKPESNKGIPPQELYKAVADKAAETFFPKLNLSAVIDAWFKNNKFAEDSIAKSVVNGVGSVVTLILRVVLAPLQYIINTFLVWRLKRFVIDNKLIDNILEKSLGSLTTNNDYVYALNSVICNQLQKVVDAMDDAYINQIDNKPPVLKNDVKSNHQKKELTRLVTNLLEVLAQSKCLIPRQLEDYMKNPSYVQKIHEAFDSFLIPDVVDSAVKLIKTLYDSVMNKDQLEEHLSNFLSLVNEAFKTGKKVTEKEFRDKELEISRLTDRILELTITEAVNKKFDFSIERKMNQINEFIGSLQSNISTFESAMKEKLNALAIKINQENRTESVKLLKEILQASKEFKTYRSTELRKLESDKEYDSNIKDLISGLLTKDSAYCEETDILIRDLLEIQEQLFRGISIPVLRKVSIPDSLTACKDRLKEVHDSLQKRKAWSEGKDFEKIKPIDFSISQFKPFKDFVTRTAHARIKERVDGMIEFYKDPLNYRYGIFHHLLFLPFVQEKFQKQDKPPKRENAIIVTQQT